MSGLRGIGRHKTLVGMLLAALVTAGMALSAPASAYVYWGNVGSNAIGRANLDGTSPIQAFIPGLSQPTGVAVDGQFVYWAGTATIERGDLTGANVNASFITGASTPITVAVDGQHVYWTNRGTGTIGRANLDGTGANQNFITGLSAAGGLAVDAHYVYWTEGGTGAIGRANLDGSGVNRTFITGASAPAAVAVDDIYIFWANSGNGTIGRALLSGFGVNQSVITAATAPDGIAIAEPYVYWTNSGPTNSIGRAETSGVQINQAFIPGASNPWGVAVNGGPASSASVSTTSMAFGTQPLGTIGPPLAVALTNTGHRRVHVSRMGLYGTGYNDFIVTSDGCTGDTLEPSGACTVVLRFAPIGTTVTKVVRTHKVNTKKCVTRAVTGPVTFTISHMAQARLSRGRVVFATGMASLPGSKHLYLRLRRALVPGRYTLTLTERHGRHTVTLRERVTLA